MHTLPHPIHFSFQCQDRTGASLLAEVTATQDDASSPFVWHAVFPASGSPPAEMLGSSRSLADIRSDIQTKVRTLLANGGTDVRGTSPYR
ncbi:hypothetical protein [Luteibacter aegosomatissinici]|uniref:hypothetical protein n=1 Tax=Luteibacter aegosomatissinici TaxID=2911539 RepID=UPI001FF8E414|nr:hypothetical protein [Luteibacter aegosomatissinici]UPG92767.1 hypothetical protein L2Y97_12920 [Luteibacter aegosomatissinici]